MKSNNTMRITLMAICIVINIVVGFTVMAFKLPIFLDTIGTFTASFLIGPISGALVGVGSGLINGLTYDPVAIFFIPVQITLGFLGGALYKKGYFENKKIIIGISITTILSSIIASFIAAYVFGGVSASGISFVVMYLKEAGVNLVASVFSTQIIFDLVDKFISVFLVLGLLKSIPKNIKNKISYVSKDK